jgi:glycosyltransferase involved in cell wall biosynthesis
MMRRLVVIHYPFFGGPQNQALRLNEPLLRRGVSSVVVLPAEPGGAAERLEEAGVEVVRVPLARLRATRAVPAQLRYLRRFPADVGRLRRIIAELRPDVVEVAGYVNPQGALAAKTMRVPVVWQILDTRTPPALRTALAPLVRACADSVMTTGVHVARVHRAAIADRRRLTPFFPPVDTAEFKPDPQSCLAARRELGLGDDDFVFGAVANITPQKGIELLIRAALDLRRRIPSPRLLLLGREMETHGSYASWIRDLAAPLLEDRTMIILDPGNRVAQLLPALDLAVMSSVPRSEGISTTVLEAMSCGIPVVTTDVGGLREAVSDGRDGIVVPAQDVRALATAIETMAREPARRSRMGELARARAVSDFDVEVCADAHLRAYATAAGRSS